MLGALVKKAFPYIAGMVILISVFLIYSLYNSNGVHESSLALEFSSNQVFPTYAKSKDGKPYTGSAYGTFFGEKSLDCTEWSGQFTNGIPSGVFKLYSACGSPSSSWVYNNGTFVKRT